MSAATYNTFCKAGHLIHSWGNNTGDFYGEMIPKQCNYCGSTELKNISSDDDIHLRELDDEEYFVLAPELFFKSKDAPDGEMLLFDILHHPNHF